MYLNSTISGFYPMMHRLYAVLYDDTSWYLWDLEVLQFKDILTSSRFFVSFEIRERCSVNICWGFLAQICCLRLYKYRYTTVIVTFCRHFISYFKEVEIELNILSCFFSTVNVYGSYTWFRTFVWKDKVL